MINKCVVLFLALLAVGCYCKELDGPEVYTPLGTIKGYYRISDKNKTFAAFEGIPYAKPPVGPLRFKDAEPAEPWPGVWNAVLPTQCVQLAEFSDNAISGEEDCLHINVYVPRENPDPSERLDVIVHIHGGAFMISAGHTYAHPEYIIDNDVIFVTFNYRLGLFGFLSTEDDVIPGNNGLKDQVLALRWVQKYITVFGGNPESITLTGLSAGACSTHYHFLSPMSKGLFHRAMANSGSATIALALQEEPLQKAQLLAKSVGCPKTPTTALAECLRTRPYLQLINSLQNFFAYKFLPASPFAPVVEKNSSKPFIDQNPYYLLTQGLVNDVPFIVSNVEHEGLYPLGYLTNSLDEINDKWLEIAPYLLDYNYTLNSSLWDKDATDIKNYYIGENTSISLENFRDFIQMCTDRYFVVDMVNAVKLHAKVAKSPVYYYNFAYSYENNPNKTIGHGTDGMYFYKGMYPVEMTENDLKVKNIMIELLTSFAKKGIPNVEGVTWQATGSEELTFLNITGPEGLIVDTKKELGPSDFWENLGFMENQNLL